MQQRRVHSGNVYPNEDPGHAIHIIHEDKPFAVDNLVGDVRDDDVAIHQRGAGDNFADPLTLCRP